MFWCWLQLQVAFFPLAHFWVLFFPSLSKVCLPSTGVKSRQFHPCHCSWALLSLPTVCPRFLSPSTVCVLICKMLALISLLFEPFCCFSQTPSISLKPLLSNECNCLIHLLPFFLNLKTVLNIDFCQMQPMPQLPREPTSPLAASWRPGLCCLMPAVLPCLAELIPVPVAHGRRRPPCLRSQQPPQAEHTL